MARTLTAAAQTEANKVAGAEFVRILEVQWDSGTKFYSTRPLTTPVVATGIVVDFPSRQVSGVPGKANAQSTITIELEDTDHSLRTTFFDVLPGPQNVLAFVHLFFIGTTWPTDRITEIGGVMTTPLRWDENRSVWSITLRGFEYHFDKDIGFLLTLEDFAELNCSEAEGRIIPIVYGNPCQRVPAFVVDRPGGGRLAQRLDVVPDTSLVVNRTAAKGAFTSGSTIDLIMGYANRWERITGSFATSGTAVFDINSTIAANRGAVLTEGTLDLFSEGGDNFVSIAKSDLGDNGEQSRAGYPLYVQVQNGAWAVLLVSRWQFEDSRIVVSPRSTLDLVTGSPYKLGSVAGQDVKWPPGTPIYEDGTWTFIVNFLPSKEVVSVEAKGTINVPGGDSRTAWLRYNTAFFTVNLDNKSFNTVLGRAGGDPGVTTVSLQFAPTQVGFESETVWVTLKGITDDNTPSGTVLTNPADIIENLLENDFLGNLGATFINSASFTTAAALISTDMAFAIVEPKKLNDLVTQLAHQGQMTYWWDEGKANVNFVNNTLSGSQLTLTPANIARGTLSTEEQPVHEFTTELLGRYSTAIPAPELKIVRKSAAAQTEFGINRDELNLWGYQAAVSVALTVEHWLIYRLQRQRVVRFTTYLVGLHLQPGDVVTIDVDDGNGNIVFNSILARVITVRQTPGNPKASRMERIEITAEIKLWTFAIETAVPDETTCNTVLQESLRVGGQQRRLYVRSDGVNSMYVLPDGGYAGNIMEEGGDGIADPIDQEVCDPDVEDLCIDVHVAVALSSNTSGSSSSSSCGAIYGGEQAVPDGCDLVECCDNLRVPRTLFVRKTSDSALVDTMTFSIASWNGSTYTFTCGVTGNSSSGVGSAEWTLNHTILAASDTEPGFKCGSPDYGVYTIAGDSNGEVKVVDS